MGEGTQRFLQQENERLQGALDGLYAHIRAVIEEPDEGWTGWRAALEGLLPESERRREGEARAVVARLRENGDPTLTYLADRLEAFTDGPDG